MHPKVKGEKTQIIVLAELIKREYIVLTPYGDNVRYDLVIDADNLFKRLQCKTGTIKNDCVIFNAKRTQSNSKRCTYKYYTKDEIDGFIVHCADNNKTYIVPIEAMSSKDGTRAVSGGYLHLNSNSWGKNIKWAEDFDIDNKNVVEWLQTGKFKIKEHTRPPMLAKRCIGCDKVKHKNNFYIDQHSIYGLQPYCKDCTRDRQREWSRQKRNKEKLVKV